MSELGYVIHSAGSELIPHLDGLKPRVMFVMNGWSLADQIKQRYPSCYVIHRVSSGDEATMHFTPGATLSHLQKRAAERQNNRVHINLFTEPEVENDAQEIGRAHV